jgi:hypothetical protein
MLVSKENILSGMSGFTILQLDLHLHNIQTDSVGQSVEITN